MPRGDKSKFTDKQEIKADHIAESYKEKGVSTKEAERRAWATVNKDDGGGQTGVAAAASRSPSERSASAKKAAATRKAKAEHRAH